MLRESTQRDIITLLDNSSIIIVKYNYDAWGNHTVTDVNGNDISSDATHIANLNPFRYRGYYYDTETDLYYLQSRYYDPELGRFINADTIKYLNPETINGVNLYAYCNNNPVMLADPSGHFAIATLLIGALIGAAIGFASAYIPDVVKNFDDGFDWSDFNTFEANWIKYVGATVGGAISGIGSGFITSVLASGVGSVIEAAFIGEISSFEDVMTQFILGGILSGIGYGVSKGITSIFANKKIFGILGDLSDNLKVNKRLAKAGFGYLKIGKHGLNTVYSTMYDKYGFKKMQNIISRIYDFVVGLAI